MKMDRTYQNLCNASKAVLGGKFITINTYTTSEIPKKHSIPQGTRKNEAQSQQKLGNNKDQSGDK